MRRRGDWYGQRVSRRRDSGTNVDSAMRGRVFWPWGAVSQFAVGTSSLDDLLATGEANVWRTMEIVENKAEILRMLDWLLISCYDYGEKPVVSRRVVLYTFYFSTTITNADCRDIKVCTPICASASNLA